MSRIEIHGARQHNLKGLDLVLPKRALIVFTGVSGSGKSSLAFDTLHGEGQRRYLEALAIHGRGLGRGLSRPRVDAITGLPPTVALDQRFTAPSRRMTVGTFSELHATLAVLFARAGVQHCPICDAVIQPRTHDEIVEEIMGLERGARLLLESPVQAGPGVLDEIARAGFSRVRVDGTVTRLEEVGRGAPVRDLRVVVDRIRLQPDRRDRVHDAVRLAARAGRGVIIAAVDAEEYIFTDRPYCRRDDLSLPSLEPRMLSFTSQGGRCEDCDALGENDGERCGACEGTRLSPAARAVRWRGHGLVDVLSAPVGSLPELLGDPSGDPLSQVVLADLRRRVGHLVDVGLGSLALLRSATTLSRGQLQRLRLARQVSSRLSGVLYVLDEPTAGLHAEDVPPVLALLRDLVAQGNTVLVVEHQPDVIRAADHVVDVGPGPGRQGGEIVYQGSVSGLLASEGATGRWLSGRVLPPTAPAVEPASWVRLNGCRLRDHPARDLALPLEALAAITGRSGSGKSTILAAFRSHLARHLKLEGTPPPPVDGVEGLGGVRRMVVADRSAARSTRTNPATYSGLWEILRELLASTQEAQIRALPARFFSLHVKGGRCEGCQGTGQKRVDLGFLPDVHRVCPVCDGRRFNRDVLEVRWKGRAADEILALSVDEARVLLAGHPRLERILRALQEVGLGYVVLGQAASTLSGGEVRRLKLARELARAAHGGLQGTVFVIDDPSIGLHPQDVSALLGLFRRLVSEGATVWLATHDLELASGADVRLGA